MDRRADGACWQQRCVQRLGKLCGGWVESGSRVLGPPVTKVVIHTKQMPDCGLKRLDGMTTGSGLFSLEMI